MSHKGLCHKVDIRICINKASPAAKKEPRRRAKMHSGKNMVFTRIVIVKK